MKTKRLSVVIQRWGKCALTLLLACALLAGLGISASARELYQGEVVDPVIPKPTVTVQGNLVVDKPGGKPTGFYELALCVRSGRTIVGPAPADWTTVKELTEDEYQTVLTAIENNTAPAGITGDSYTLTYYPFTSVGGAVNINTDVLTAVDWKIQNVTYAEFDATTNTYKTPAAGASPAPSTAPAAPIGSLDAGYGQGIDPAPAAQGYDPEELTQAEAFPDITTANMLLDNNPSVAIDVENDPRMFEATGQVDYYDAANKSALLTLTASAPDNAPVVLKESTPLVVARFSYDLKRFPDVKVNDTAWAGDLRNEATGEPDAVGFWLGWDKTTAIPPASSTLPATNLIQKTPLTWLGESDPVNLYDFTNSDLMAAHTRVNQTAWVHMVTDGAPLTQRDTYFYYYLGAMGQAGLGGDQTDGQQTLEVVVNGAPTEVPGITMPKTGGEKVLTEGTEENPSPTPGPAAAPGASPAPSPTPTPTQAQYTYFKNLLRIQDRTMVLELVNAPTFKKPSGGGGGNMILFLDWDGRLIGSLAVDKGDVRAEVEAYIEENLVHPDLRPDSAFMKNAAGTDTDLAKVASLKRDYTYRGKYAYTVGGDDATLGDPNGKEYPLTNKLDYVLTKRVNTTLTQVDASTGDTVTYVHPYSLDDAVNLDPAVTDAALYPYVYGWAVVEDATAANGLASAPATDKGQWKTMHDADKNEDVWTTAGVGELAAMSHTALTNTTLPTVGTVDPAAVRTAPAFLNTADPTWTDGTRPDANDYAYELTGESSYLRFADFSDITAELARYDGKDTLIVKAVYEPGDALALGNNYRLITEPAYTKFNDASAANGGAYKVQLTLERSFRTAGVLVGTSRVRYPLIRQDTTVDVAWLTSDTPKVDHDMQNTDLSVATSRKETTYSQVDIDNGEQITFSLSLSAKHNKIDYQLTEAYNANYVAGTQRSDFNTTQLTVSPKQFVVDNYNYLLASDGSTTDDLYDCDFTTKEGSHGFVLYSTLGHFLEQATKLNNGKIAKNTYNGSVSYTTAKDANLRMNLGGAEPGFINNTTLQDAFIAAAKACEAHKNDPAYDCWDVNLDCAKLTYHQAQWFLLDYQGNPGADILSVATAEDGSHKLPFCHYHVSCSGGHVPSAPTTWKDLVDKLREYNDAAAGSDDQKNAQADLEALDLTTLENLTSIRSNANGRKYSNLESFLNALKDADAQLKAAGADVSWVSLQYTILNGAPDPDPTVMRDAAQEEYWWYAGATTAPKVTDFADLLTTADTIRTPVTLKDGDATFLPKSALTAATFPENSAEYLTSASPSRRERTAWVTLTDNLVPSHLETMHDPDGTPNSGDETMEYTYGRFSDMDTFLDLFLDAYNAIYDAAEAAGDPLPADRDAWWKAIQTKLLRDKDPADNLGDHDGTGDNEFWWKGGQTPFRVTNLSTLVECVRRLNGPSGDDRTAAQAEWDRLKVADIEGVDISQTLRWKGSDTAHPMYPNTANDLFAGDEDIQKMRILNQLKSAVSRFDAAKTADPGTMLNWNNIQYLLLHDKDPLPSNDVVYDQSTYYWWKNGNTTGNAVNLSTSATAEANLAELLRATYRSEFNDPGVASSILTATQGADNSFWSFTKLITQKVRGTEFPRADDPDPDAANANDTYDGPDVLNDVKAVAYPGATSADVDAFMTVLTDFRDAAKADPNQGTSDPYGMPDYNWQEVQYYCLTNTFLPYSDQTIKDLRDKDKALAGDYWWYYADTRVPPEPPISQDDDPAGPAGPLVDLLSQADPGDPYPILGQVTADMIADSQFIYMDANRTVPMDFDNFAAIQIEFLYYDFSAMTEGYFTNGARPSWAQMMYYWVSAYEDDPEGLAGYGTAASHDDAVQGLLDYGWTAADCPAGALDPLPAEGSSEDDIFVIYDLPPIKTVRGTEATAKARMQGQTVRATLWLETSAGEKESINLALRKNGTATVDGQTLPVDVAANGAMTATHGRLLSTGEIAILTLSWESNGDALVRALVTGDGATSSTSTNILATPANGESANTDTITDATPSAPLLPDPKPDKPSSEDVEPTTPVKPVPSPEPKPTPEVPAGELDAATDEREETPLGEEAKSAVTMMNRLDAIDGNETEAVMGNARTPEEHGSYYSREDVARYIQYYKKLPDNYITKAEATDLGWKSGRSVEKYAPGKRIGGDCFRDDKAQLPAVIGRTWTECDIDARGKRRGAERIVYSSDGLIYYTPDHYRTFEQLYDGRLPALYRPRPSL